jgi:hypothetical protein
MDILNEVLVFKIFTVGSGFPCTPTLLMVCLASATAFSEMVKLTVAFNAQSCAFSWWLINLGCYFDRGDTVSKKYFHAQGANA